MTQNYDLIFIAHGIGITPFRSMITYMIDSKKNKPTLLIYIIKNKEELLFSDLFKKAEVEGFLKPLYLKKFASATLLKEQVKTLTRPTYYISGPQPVVEKYRTLLWELGVNESKIKTDLFSGYGEL